MGMQPRGPRSSPSQEKWQTCADHEIPEIGREQRPSRSQAHDALPPNGGLEIKGQTIRLEPGDSWLVPPNAEHTYRILETFTAAEATAPPAQVHGRDER